MTTAASCRQVRSGVLGGDQFKLNSFRLDVRRKQVGTVRLSDIGELARNVYCAPRELCEIRPHLDQPLVDERLIIERPDGIQYAIFLRIRFCLNLLLILLGDPPVQTELSGGDDSLLESAAEFTATDNRAAGILSPRPKRWVRIEPSLLCPARRCVHGGPACPIVGSVQGHSSRS